MNETNSIHLVSCVSIKNQNPCPAGMLYMVMALSLVFIVLILEAAPVYFLLSAQIRNIPLTNLQMGVSVSCLLLVVVVCVFATLYPINRGARSLWQKELPNG